MPQIRCNFKNQRILIAVLIFGQKLSEYMCFIFAVNYFSLFSLAAKGAHLWLDTSTVNAAIVTTYASACDKYFGGVGSKSKVSSINNHGSNGLSGGPTAFYRPSPISFAKAVKNPAELEGMRNSHLR